MRTPSVPAISMTAVMKVGHRKSGSGPVRKTMSAPSWSSAVMARMIGHVSSVVTPSSRRAMGRRAR